MNAKRDAIDIHMANEIVMNREMLQRAMNLKTGRTYSLYRAPKSAERIYTKAVRLKRKLVSHHNNYARFQKENGMFECFTYGELMTMIEKPKGIKIEKEGVGDDE